MTLTVGRIEFGPRFTPDGSLLYDQLPDIAARGVVEGGLEDPATEVAEVIANDNTSSIIPSLATLKDRPGFTYLGTPYSRYAAGLDAAASEAAQAAAVLMNMGLRIFSPIAHSHFIGTEGGLDNLDWTLWQEQDQPLIDAASSLIVLMIDGWSQSVGLRHEIECFYAAGKPILYLRPEVLSKRRMAA